LFLNNEDIAEIKLIIDKINNSKNGVILTHNRELDPKKRLITVTRSVSRFKKRSKRKSKNISVKRSKRNSLNRSKKKSKRVSAKRSKKKSKKKSRRVSLNR